MMGIRLLLRPMIKGPIGVFDSGYGGLTILRDLIRVLPDYDYLYLGDNARAPYGQRSFNTIFQYTLESVKWLFKQNCPLVILACNTASAKALKNIQQLVLPHLAPDRRVLGIIRPTSEVIGNYTKTNAIGILATTGTVNSGSYDIEIKHFFPEVKLFQQACPLWVPMVENNDFDHAGGDYFIEKYTQQLFKQSPEIDTVLLACTHYPLLVDKITALCPAGTTVLSQGPFVANSLVTYLERHPEMEERLTKNRNLDFYTTDAEIDFDSHASLYFGNGIFAKHADLEHE